MARLAQLAATAALVAALFLLLEAAAVEPRAAGTDRVCAAAEPCLVSIF